MLRIDHVILVFGPLGLIAGALQLELPLVIPFSRVLLKLGEHLQGEFEIGGRHGGKHMRFDGGIDRPCRDTPADPSLPIVQTPALAFVDGVATSRALIAHRHPPAASPAED